MTSRRIEDVRTKVNTNGNRKRMFLVLFACGVAVFGQVVNPNWGRVTRLDSPTVYFSLFVDRSIETVDVEKIPEAGGDYFLRLKVTYIHAGNRIHALICGVRFYAGSWPHQTVRKEGFIECDDIRKHIEANMLLMTKVGQTSVYTLKTGLTCG